MLSFALLAGGVIAAQANRIQPEAAKLAPQVDAASLGVHQVPAITLSAMRTVMDEGVPDPFGVRDPARTFASRSLTDFLDDRVLGKERHSIAEVQGLGSLFLADTEADVDSEMKSMRQTIAEANADNAQFVDSEAEWKASISELNEMARAFSDITVRIKRLDEKDPNTADRLAALSEELATLSAKFDARPRAREQVERAGGTMRELVAAKSATDPVDSVKSEGKTRAEQLLDAKEKIESLKRVIANMDAEEGKTREEQLLDAEEKIASLTRALANVDAALEEGKLLSSNIEAMGKDGAPDQASAEVNGKGLANSGVL